jgi:hypothetical protein
LDELGSWGISLGSLSEVLNKTLYTQGQGPIYFLILSKWIYYFGDSKDTLRFLSLIFNYLNLITIYFIGRELFGKNNAKYLCIVYLCTPIFYSDEILARPYGLANLILSLILYYTLRYQTSSKKSLLVVISILSGILILTHYLYILGLASIAVFVLFQSYSSEILKKVIYWLTAVFAGCTVSLVPFLHVIFNKMNNLHELSHTPSPNLFLLIFVLFITTATSTLITIVLAKLLYIKDKNTGYYDKVIFNGILATIIPYVSLYSLARLSSGPFFVYRYFAIASLFAAIFSASIIFSYPRIKNLLLLGSLSIILIENYLVIGTNQCGGEDPWVNDFKEIVASHPTCGVYASAGFIEAQTPAKLIDPNYQDFLRSPISYYYKEPFTLLPLSISTTFAREYFDSEIINRWRNEKCLNLVLYSKEFEIESTKINSLSKEIETILDTLNFKVIAENVNDNSQYRVLSAQTRGLTNSSY